MKKIIAAALCFITLISAVCGSACGKSEKVDNKASKHVDNSVSTEYDFIKNGTTEYSLVLPKAISKTVETAKKEFVYLFEKATGIKIKTVTDEGLTHSAENKYVSLGDTTLLSSAGIEKNSAELGLDGCRVLTKDKTIFCFGGGDSGTLNSVYFFMERTFNYETYWKDCVEIDTGVTDLKLSAYDVTEIPDIPQRASGHGYVSDTTASYDANMFVQRMKMSPNMNEFIMTMHSEFDNPNSTSKSFHNSLICFPRATYENEHSAWYSSNGDQLCYTAHGNVDEFKAMTEEAAKKVENSLKIYTPEKYPFKNTISISMEDNTNCCTCDSCKALKNAYGVESAAVIIFINRVGELVERWMNDPANASYKRDDFHIIFFAYENFVEPPVNYDEKRGVYKPKDEKVTLRDNVGVYLAPINWDYQQSPYSETNETGRKVVDAWGDISDYIYLWTYSTNFMYYMYMYDSTNFYNEGYAYLASKNVKYIFNQSQWNQAGAATAWHILKFYLESKLSWNSSLDAKVLTDNYFKAMYRDAAPTMRAIYEDMRLHLAKVCADNNLYAVRSIYMKIENKNMWQMPTLTAWMDRFDSAIETVKRYKELDKDLYDAIVNRIELEWISPAYIAMKLHSQSFEKSTRLDIINRFEKVVIKNGMIKVSDIGGTGIETVFDSLK